MTVWGWIAVGAATTMVLIGYWILKKIITIEV